MELLSVTRLPEGPEWSYEVKLDGYRAQAIHGARLRLLSRRGKDFTSQFAETYRALASAVPAGSIIDGELVALDAQGRPDFQSIQNSRSSGASVVFFAFDILMLAGRDVRMLPLLDRRQLLRDALRTSDLVQVSESFSIPAAQMIALAREHGLEGVVAKQAEQPVRVGSAIRSVAEAVPHAGAGVRGGRLSRRATTVSIPCSSAFIGGADCTSARAFGLASFLRRGVAPLHPPGAAHHRPMPFRQCPRVVAGTVGSGTYSGEDEELRVGAPAIGGPVLLSRVDRERSPAARELHRCARGYGRSRGREGNMTDKDDDLLLEWVALHHRLVPVFRRMNVAFTSRKLTDIAF